MLHYFSSYTEATKVRLFFLCVVVITFFCFVPTLYNELLLNWDDGFGIVDNVMIRQLSFETIRWAFTTFFFEDWLPLVWISFAVEYALWGLNPVGYHLVNNILHCLNAGLFYLISLALLKRYASLNNSSYTLVGNRIYYCALLAALLFAVHPLRVESVAWAFERKDVLSLFFGLLALRAYLRYSLAADSVAASSASRVSFLTTPGYWTAIIFYCLSLLSKAMLVSFPLILLIIDWFPLQRIKMKGIGSILLEKGLFIVCAGINAAILIDVHTLSKMPFTESDMLSRILIAFKSIMSYLVFMAWPVNLSPFYLHPQKIHEVGFEYLFPIFFFIAVTLACILLLKKLPVCMAVWSFYVITLIPVLGFIQVNVTQMADRYTYVPGLAVSLLVALAITALAGKYAASPMVTNAILVGTLVILTGSFYLTVRQIAFWKDDVTLWSRAIELKPHFSGRMYFQRASGYEDRGDFANALQDMNEAIAIATMKKRPKMEELYFKRSSIFMKLGDTDRAAADYNYGKTISRENEELKR